MALCVVCSEDGGFWQKGDGRLNGAFLQPAAVCLAMLNLFPLLSLLSPFFG